MVVAAGVLLTSKRARRHPSPFIPPLVVLDRKFLPAAAAGLIGSAAYLGTIVGLPSALSRAHVIDAVGIGLVLVPTAASVAIASTFNGPAVRRLGHAGTTLVSLLFLLAGTAAMSVFGVDRAIGTVALLGIPLGIGFGLLTPPLVDVVTRRFEGGPLQSVAVGLFYLAFFLGGSVGGAVTTGIIQRNVSLPGLGSGFAVAESVLAILALAGTGIMVRVVMRGPDHE